MANAADTIVVDGELGAGLGDDIRMPKLAHVVAARLRKEIFSGKFKPGSMLLPENKLLSIFNVSRPTLREALRILESEALISIGRGMRSGPTVLGPSLHKAAEYTNLVFVSEGVTMLDLHEARMFFEPAIVRSLSGSSRTATVKRLREHIAEMELALKEKRYMDVVAGTNRFHETLARASGNKTIALLVGLVQTISDEAYGVILSTEAKRTTLHNNMAKTVSGYTVLCDLVEKGKMDEAASFWRRYMERGMEFLKRSKIGDRRLVPSGIGYDL